VIREARDRIALFLPTLAGGGAERVNLLLARQFIQAGHAVDIVLLRKTLLVSLDDLLAVVREFLNLNVSRSGLDRRLRRHGVSNLCDLQAKAARPKHSGFKAYEPGYIHIDMKYLPEMADETSRRYLFVAILDLLDRYGRDA
jgi:hypothetical protein